MNWDAVGALAELLGALAVVVTIGFLAVQMRQNTKALRSESMTRAAAATQVSGGSSLYRTPERQRPPDDGRSA